MVTKLIWLVPYVTGGPGFIRGSVSGRSALAWPAAILVSASAMVPTQMRCRRVFVHMTPSLRRKMLYPLPVLVFRNKIHSTKGALMRKGVVVAVALAFALLSGIAAAQEKPTSRAKKAAASAPKHVVMTASELKWEDGPPSLPAGVKMAV